ncbi:MAG: RNase adapter RapZ [Bacilli bacterium]|nr:RNase adapter RapZ [Bacilli bacterium]
MNKVNLVIVSGLSGAGRTTLASVCEELGYYVVEDLPSKMLPSLLTVFENDPITYGEAAVFVNISVAPSIIAEAKKRPSLDVTAIGLDCSQEVLLSRFRLTRHIHPLQPRGYTLLDAIKKDEEDMERCRASFDIYIDTTNLTEKDLRKLAAHLLSKSKGKAPISVVFSSFGYKYGLARDSEVVLDARLLKNPYWVPELRKLTGIDQPVIDYIDKDPKTAPFLTKLYDLVGEYIKGSVEDGRAFAFIAVGCSGGQHRSVYVAQHLYDHFKGRFNCLITHRELSRYREDGKN